MYDLEHVYPMEEHPEFKDRGVMSIISNYLKISFNYKSILKIQTRVIPCQQFVNFSVFPDLNVILSCTFKGNKFPHTYCTI
jgi:hypothetical protein